MLVGAADIGRDDLEDDAMFDPSSVWGFQFRVIDVPDLDLARLQIDDASVFAHVDLLRCLPDRLLSMPANDRTAIFIHWVPMSIRRQAIISDVGRGQ
jgi:hypothetical protein